MRLSPVIKIILRSILAFVALAIVPLLYNLVTNNTPGYLKYLESHSSYALATAVALCIVLAVSSTIAESGQGHSEVVERSPSNISTPTATSTKPRKAQRDYTWVAVLVALAGGMTASLLWDRYEKDKFRRESNAEVSAIQQCIAGTWNVVSIKQPYSDVYGSATLTLKEGGIERWKFDGTSRATRGGNMTMRGIIAAGRYRNKEVVLRLTGTTQYSYTVEPSVVLPPTITVTPIGGIANTQLALDGVTNEIQRDIPAPSTTYNVKCEDQSMTLTWSTGSIMLGKS